MILRCLIADDEPLAHSLLEGYASRLKTLQVVGHTFNAFETIDFLNENAVDILFLDIQMPGLTGLEMLRTLTHPPAIILTTAYSEHALESFDLGVMDYLLKPIRFERFLKAVNRVVDLKKPLATETKISTPEKIKEPDFIILKDGTTQHKINLYEILYAQALGNFTKVFTTKQTIVASQSMKQLEDALPKEQFIRVHKSYIVNISKIIKTENNIVYLDKTEIPIGLLYKLELEKRLGI